MSFLSFFGQILHHNMVNYIVIILPGQGFISDPQGFLPNYIILAGFIILFTQGFFLFYGFHRYRRKNGDISRDNRPRSSVWIKVFLYLLRMDILLFLKYIFYGQQPRECPQHMQLLHSIQIK